jgi:hypothetical protein
MPSSHSSSHPESLQALSGADPTSLCAWGSQPRRRDRIHGEVVAALNRRCHQLAEYQGHNQDAANQSAAIAAWLAEGERKVEFMATLWVGRSRLPVACMRDYVARFGGACLDNIGAALAQQGLQLNEHFMIWMVLEKSLSRSAAEQRLHAHLMFSMTAAAIPHFRKWRGERSKNANQLWREIVLDPAIWTRCTPSARIRSCRHDTRGDAGAILYCLKEVGRSDLTELEPVALQAQEAPSDAMVGQTSTEEPSRARRLRRASHASGVDLLQFRSVSADGQPIRVGSLACRRRRFFGLEAPDAWRVASS